MFGKTMFGKTMIAATLAMGFAGTAAACDTYSPPVYKTVVSHEVRWVPKTVSETKYDCHGRPYAVAKTIQVKVVVAVTKRVRVG